MGSRSASVPAGEGFCKGASLPLPAGEVIAADGVQYQPGGSGQLSVAPSWDEAYVIVQLHDGVRWQATWLPYAGQWQTQRLEHSWFHSDLEHALAS